MSWAHTRHAAPRSILLDKSLYVLMDSPQHFLDTAITEIVPVPKVGHAGLAAQSPASASHLAAGMDQTPATTKDCLVCVDFSLTLAPANDLRFTLGLESEEKHLNPLSIHSRPGLAPVTTPCQPSPLLARRPAPQHGQGRNANTKNRTCSPGYRGVTKKPAINRSLALRCYVCVVIKERHGYYQCGLGVSILKVRNNLLRLRIPLDGNTLRANYFSEIPVSRPTSETSRRCL